jgi:hypothetical protein
VQQLYNSGVQLLRHLSVLLRAAQQQSVCDSVKQVSVPHCHQSFGRLVSVLVERAQLLQCAHLCKLVFSIIGHHISSQQIQRHRDKLGGRLSFANQVLTLSHTAYWQTLRVERDLNIGFCQNAFKQTTITPVAINHKL